MEKRPRPLFPYKTRNLVQHKVACFLLQVFLILSSPIVQKDQPQLPQNRCDSHRLRGYGRVHFDQFGHRNERSRKNGIYPHATDTPPHIFFANIWYVIKMFVHLQLIHAHSPVSKRLHPCAGHKSSWPDGRSVALAAGSPSPKGWRD